MCGRLVLMTKVIAWCFVIGITIKGQHFDEKENHQHGSTWYTEEDKPVKIDLTKNTNAPADDKPMECKATITQLPSHGILYLSDKLLTLEDKFPITNISYRPNQDFFGEETFICSVLCQQTSVENMDYILRVIVRPQIDPIEITDLTVTVNSNENVIHIPLVPNIRFVDSPDVCLTETPKPANQKDQLVTFGNVAEELGMTAAQSMISTSPNCLFDNWDLKHKRWIKGSFCMVDTLFGAASTGDLDNDGNLDIYYARVDGEDKLWKNLGDGTFTEVTFEANLTQTARHHSSAVVWVDIDNDGDSDIFVGTSGDKRHFLYVNDGAGHFVEDAERRGLAVYPNTEPFQTSCQSIGVGDFNNDGWLDLYTTEWLVHLNQKYDYNNASHSGVRLFKNLGFSGQPGYFEDVTTAANLGKMPQPEIPVTLFDFRPYNLDIHGSFADIAPGPYQFSATFADIDDDGFPDLLITGDFKTSRLYWNNGNGTFTDGTDRAKVGTDENAMGSTVADYDLDGHQDWFLTSIYDSRKLDDVEIKTKDEPFFQKTGYIFGSTGNRLYKYEGDRKFSDKTDEANVRNGGWGWGAAFFDFDNDGDLDIIHTNGWDDPETTDTDFFHNVPNLLFENRFDETGKNIFKSVAAESGTDDRRDGRGLFVFDYDNDGDQDVFIINIWDKPILYQNRNGNLRDWIRVKVLECCVNRESLGAKVFLHSPRYNKEIIREVRSASSFSGQGENVVHFGLGLETERVFTVRIHWPVTNNTRIIESVPRRSFLQVRDLKGVRNALERTRYLKEWAPKCSQVIVKEIVTEPAHGKVFQHSKYLTYKVKPGYAGKDSFAYSVTNGETSGTGMIYLKIQPSEGKIESKNQITTETSKFASYSGYGNNLEHPEWGKAMSALHRLVPPAYSDGYQSLSGITRPNPRLISNVLCQQNSDVLSKEDLNEMHVHFGQLVAHDTDFSSPFANTLATENEAIEIPAGDPYFDPFSTGKQLMRFRRSAREPNSGNFKEFPREQINKVSSYLDLSVIYGSDNKRATKMRTGRNGKLKLDPDDNLPKNDEQIPNLNLLGGPRERLLISGDTRVNVQPGLIALHTLFAREHNKICDELQTHSFMENADDDTLFQTARTITRAKWQAIVWYEFLPTVIGTKEFQKLGDYQGYNESVQLRIFNEFATVAFRYGHSQVGNTLHRFDANWKAVEKGHLNLRDAYFNPGRILNEGGIEPLVRGMLAKEAQEVDTQFVDGVRNFLFGTNTQGLDLVSYGIQRSRDHGIPDYNTVRTALGLSVKRSFEDITADKAVQEKLKFLYNSVNDIDLWMGGLAEDHVEGGCVGETMAHIIAKQFDILRAGDRFWFENADIDTMFGRLRGYAETRMVDILKRNTNIEWPGSAFHAHPWRKYSGQ